MSPFKQYIGDGVYADFDGYHLVLTTEDGLHVSNRICLEPTVYGQLNRYVEWLNMSKQQRPTSPDVGERTIAQMD